MNHRLMSLARSSMASASGMGVAPRRLAIISRQPSTSVLLRPFPSTRQHPQRSLTATYASLGKESASAAPSASSAPADSSLNPFKNLVKDKLFTCTMCGKCCTGEGEVWVTDREAGAITAHLDITATAFEERFTRQRYRMEGFHLLTNLTDEQKSCVFLLPDNKCSIHTVRPGQCSTYPWWPELMDEAGWQDERWHVCEGFNHEDAVALTDEGVESAARQLREANVQEELKSLALGKKLQQDRKKGSQGGWLSSYTKPEKTQGF
ncbi:hypothetical protein FOA52_006852 [Chlamydomonas sp. UWO 241]|nr:hypothetical protein FOA52_006852 [Chlamydomonas sp. UWO 241]